MEPNAMAGGIYSNVQPGSMLGLEMSLHHPVPVPVPVQPQNPHQNLISYHNQEENYHPPAQQSSKQAHPISAKPKNQALTLSDDDEPGFSADDGNKKIASPWQRMKWTDNMVRLLIMVVFYIGDEVVSEAAAADNSNNKKKGGVYGGGGGGVLQRKGKWKSVSRAMMERGFYVSPQQCEDKFNDLNKRYKRVNDILGKGISCRVVENQSLLDNMDHISLKMKEEVKKLLNSKHLYFKEMCAYHNSCGHGGGGAPPPQATTAQPLQICLHSENTNNSNTNVNIVPSLSRGENEGTKLLKRDADDDADDEDDEHDGDDDDDEDDDNDLNFSSRKRLKKSSSPSIQQLGFELTSILQDGTKSQAEKRQWMRRKLMRLDEERVGIQSRSLELEKQRLKWLKFSSKKEREMEKERLLNERLRLENERMVLVVRQRELDLLDQQQHSSNRKSGDPSSITG